MDYRDVIVVLITSALPACVFILAASKGVVVRHLWRYPESGIVAAFLADAVRRLWLITHGYPTPTPEPLWMVASFLTLTLMSVTLWSRAVQILRHRQRNRDQLRLYADLIAQHKEQQ